MDHPKVRVRRTRTRGRGVFAVADIRAGEVIAEFDGAVYDGSFDDWTDDLLQHTIQFDTAKWRDSAGLARLINHSCEPNCGIKRLFRVVAMRPIAAGEEITWDYEMTERSWWWRMKCRCGAAECRKVIGSYSRMPARVRRRYKGYISSWLTRRSRRRRPSRPV
jgi:hypothetical protein